MVNFIKDNYHHFSREGLRYAIEKMESEMKKSLLGYKPGEESEESEESQESQESEVERTNRVKGKKNLKVKEKSVKVKLNRKEKILDPINSKKRVNSNKDSLATTKRLKKNID